MTAKTCYTNFWISHTLVQHAPRQVGVTGQFFSGGSHQSADVVNRVEDEPVQVHCTIAACMPCLSYFLSSKESTMLVYT